MTRKPSPFSHFDKFMVIVTATGKPVQSAANELDALRATGVLNDHEERNGRPPRYSYIPKV